MIEILKGFRVVKSSSRRENDRDMETAKNTYFFFFCFSSLSLSNVCNILVDFFFFHSFVFFLASPWQSALGRGADRRGTPHESVLANFKMVLLICFFPHRRRLLLVPDEEESASLPGSRLRFSLKNLERFAIFNVAFP